ncbi:MAG: phosphoserine phosphatase RsbU/P [Solirubrobacteraceae bacterium]|jgi:sigma-B regulation protein RsbU (phosphoserine phosphatase)|nr:phosphoserine phosphatase RsbU/P [Solirubrobacteraceae bacterium]
MKILLADDSATVRYIVEQALEHLGHECRTAEDGLLAWDAIQRFEPEVVISDWVMPGMDGEELCRRVRADPDAPYTYFIMLTSLEDRAYVLRAMEAGADDYLLKPFEPDDLQMRLIAASRVTALHRSLRTKQQLAEQEIRIAAGVQRSLLPGSPPALGGASVAGRCFPATNVGGDCFDYVADAAGRLVLFIADVAGHSISSALLMAMGRSTLRREIASGASPAAVLAATNRTMYGDLVTTELFITMFCVRYDPASGVLEYANAGHNPPLLRSGDDVLELDADGVAIGILDAVDFEARSIAMAPGDRLLLYTDGAMEALDDNGEQFGEARLHALMLADRELTPEQFVEHVFAAVRAHAGDAAQQDDITLVALQADEPPAQ